MATTARIEELRKKFDENPRRYFAPLASEYRKAGMVDEAIRICREHLPAQPGHMSGHVIYGQALFDAGQRDDARAAFETALSLDPENLIALRYLGDIARERGESDVARNWYRRYLDADPRNEEVSSQLQALTAAAAGAPSASESALAPPLIEPLEVPSPGRSADRSPTRDHSTADEPTAAGSLLGATSLDIPLDLSPPASAAPPTRPTTPAMTPPPAAPQPPTGRRGTAEVERELFGGELELAAEGAAPTGGAAVPAESRTNDDVEVSEELDMSWLTAPTGASGSAGSAEPAVFPEPSEPSANEAAPDETMFGGPGVAPAGDAAGRSGGGAARVDDGLGLETMEFVPPPRDEGRAGAMAGIETNAFSSGTEPAAAAAGSRPTETPAAFVTETMAELYLQQGFHEEALNVYRQLLEQNPGDAGLRERVTQLERGGRSSVGAAAISDDVIEAARTRQAAPRVRTARALFGSLAARRVVRRRGGDEDRAAGGDEYGGAAAGGGAAAAYGAAAFAGAADDEAAGGAAPDAPDIVARKTEEMDVAVAELPDESLPFAPVPAAPREELPSAITPSELAVMAGAPAVRDENPAGGFDLAPAEGTEASTGGVAGDVEDAGVVARRPVAEESTPVETAAPAVYDPLVDTPPAEDDALSPAGRAAAPGGDALDSFVWGSAAPTESETERITDRIDVAATPETATAQPSASPPDVSSFELAPAPPTPGVAGAYDRAGTDAIGYDLPGGAPGTGGMTPLSSSAVRAPVDEPPPPPPPPPPAAASPAPPVPTAPTAPTASVSSGGGSPRTPGGGMDALFGGARAGRDDEMAAATLAGAFGVADDAATDAAGASGAAGAGTTRPSTEVSGNPSRPAQTPLSLDHVFREPRRTGDARRDSLAFSFDQFFADAPPPSVSGDHPAAAAGDAQQAPGAPSNDLEQFNSWLEGLKKK